MSCFFCWDKTVLYRYIYDYSLYDDHFIRNTHGRPYCVWCRDTIRNVDSVLVQCKECNYYIGHMMCVAVYPTVEKCPLCFPQ